MEAGQLACHRPQFGQPLRTALGGGGQALPLQPRDTPPPPLSSSAYHTLMAIDSGKGIECIYGYEGNAQGREEGASNP